MIALFLCPGTRPSLGVTTTTPKGVTRDGTHENGKKYTFLAKK